MNSAICSAEWRKSRSPEHASHREERSAISEVNFGTAVRSRRLNASAAVAAASAARKSASGSTPSDATIVHDECGPHGRCVRDPARSIFSALVLSQAPRPNDCAGCCELCVRIRPATCPLAGWYMACTTWTRSPSSWENHAEMAGKAGRKQGEGVVRGLWAISVVVTRAVRGDATSPVGTAVYEKSEGRR